MNEVMEAAVWNLLTKYQITCTRADRFMDELLALIDAYASGDDEQLTALRRSVLHREARPQRAEGGQ